MWVLTWMVVAAMLVAREVYRWRRSRRLDALLRDLRDQQAADGA